MERHTYDSEYQDFVKRLRELRESKGLTQMQVAELLHKPQSFVSKSESGERRVDVVEGFAYARIYGVSLDVLCTGEGVDNE